MTNRLSPTTGHMRSDPNGNYVAWSDYENLNSALAEVWRTAIDCIKKVEAGELTAEEAAAVLVATIRFKGVAVPADVEN